MVVFADTSFLFAVYGNDAHTPVALNWLRETRQTVCVSELADFELCNALRFAQFAGRLAYGDAARFLAQYESDRAAGRLRLEICNLADVVREAKRLSGMYTAEQGHRAFDILHVATAISQRAERFLTFDANQKKLAEAEGIGVPF
jgi:predicted nucleic acid-binding protein